MVNLDVLISSESELIKMSDFTLDAGGGATLAERCPFPDKKFPLGFEPGPPQLKPDALAYPHTTPKRQICNGIHGQMATFPPSLS